MGGGRRVLKLQRQGKAMHMSRERDTGEREGAARGWKGSAGGAQGMNLSASLAKVQKLVLQLVM